MYLLSFQIATQSQGYELETHMYRGRDNVMWLFLSYMTEWCMVRMNRKNTMYVLLKKQAQNQACV